MKVRCEEIVDAAFKSFCKELELIEPNSEDAYALAIFLNSCIETGRFQSLKYSALVHTPKAREGANKRGNSSRLTQSFHFFMFEPFFLP